MELRDEGAAEAGVGVVEDVHGGAGSAPFDTFEYLMKKRLRFTGEAERPGAHEMGWKDTVQWPAGTVTRIIVWFERYAGKYLYHCHILEHEANDMMRPFEVVGVRGTAATSVRLR